jgi:Ran GTPase-activating protein (RanGAP) involved in mRNA processing and transport
MDPSVSRKVRDECNTCATEQHDSLNLSQALTDGELRHVCTFLSKCNALTKLDLSNNSFGTEEEGKLLAGVLDFELDTTLLSEIDLSSNCRHTTSDGPGFARGFAAALGRNKSLKILNLSRNYKLSSIKLAEGWRSRDGDNRSPWVRISDGFEQSEMPGEPEGIIVLAKAVKQNQHLVSVDFFGNKIGLVQARSLAAILDEHSSLKSLCGNLGNEVELNMDWPAAEGKERVEIGRAEAIMLAPEISRNENLAKLTINKKVVIERTLTDLVFDKDAIGTAELIILAAFLPKCHALLKLGLSNSGLAVTAAGDVLAQIIASTTVLQDLDISHNKPRSCKSRVQEKESILGFVSGVSVGIRGNKSLTKLHMKDESWRLPGEAKMAMGEALCVSSIFEVVLDDWTIKKDTTALDVSGKHLVPEDIALLMGSTVNAALTQLDVGGNDVGSFVGWMYNDPSKKDDDWRYEHSDGRHQEEKPEVGEEAMGHYVGYLALERLINNTPTLTRLDCDNTQMSADQMERIVALAQSRKKLAYLCGIPFRDESLSEFDFGESPVGLERSIVVGSFFKNATNLTKISFVPIRVRRGYPTTVTLTTAVTEVDFTGQTIGAAGAKIVAAFLPKCMALTIVQLMGCKAGATQLTELQEIMRLHPQLESLCGVPNGATEAVLAGISMDADDVAVVAAEFPHKPTLTKLDISHNTMCGNSTAGIQSIAGAFEKESTVSALVLAGMQLGRAGAGAALAKMLSVNTVLTELDLSTNHLGRVFSATQDMQAFVQSISEGLAVNNALLVLNVSNNKLGAANAKCIATALATNRTLSKLVISRNSVGKEGAFAIAHALEDHPSLQMLNISSDDTLGSGDAAIFSKLLSRPVNKMSFEIEHQGKPMAVVPGAPLPMLPVEVDNSFDAALLRLFQEQSKRRRVHLSYSREDAELLLKVQQVVVRAGWELTGLMFGQGAEWFSTWKQELFTADAVIVCFTEGNAQALNNQGVGYREKLTQRFLQSNKEAALYKEAAAIREKQAISPAFAVYVLDGIKSTPEQLFHNIGHPFYGPLDKWTGFIDGFSNPDRLRELQQQQLQLANVSTAAVVVPQSPQAPAVAPPVPVPVSAPVLASPPSLVATTVSVGSSEDLLRQQIKELQTALEQQLREQQQQLDAKDRRFEEQQQLHQQQLVELQQKQMQSMELHMATHQQQASQQAAQMQEMHQMMTHLTSELLPSPEGGAAKAIRGAGRGARGSWFRSPSSSK